VPLPEFDSDTGYLLAGEHMASWVEVIDRFGWNSVRQAQLEGLREALNLLGIAGCSRVWLNGSFVTAKELPGDFDAVWDDAGVDESLLDPIFFDLSAGRHAQKLRFKGELFPNWVNGSSNSLFAEFFQQDRLGRTKGIVVIDPREVAK
jgi:hypothetical protein